MQSFVNHVDSLKAIVGYIDQTDSEQQNGFQPKFLCDFLACLGNLWVISYNRSKISVVINIALIIFRCRQQVIITNSKEDLIQSTILLTRGRKMCVKSNYFLDVHILEYQTVTDTYKNTSSCYSH